MKTQLFLDKPSLIIRLPHLSLGLGLFLCGFNLLYFLPVVFPTAGTDLGTLRYFYIAYAIIFIGASIVSFQQPRKIWQIKPAWTLLTFVSIFIMTSRGIMDGEPFAALLQKFFTFTCLLLLPNIGMRSANWPWLWGTLIFQAIFGGIYSLYNFFIIGLNTVYLIDNSPERSFLWGANYAGSFLFLCLPLLSDFKGRFSAGISFLAENLKALFVLNRLVWLLVPVQLLLLSFINARMHQTNKAKKLSPQLRVLNGFLILLILLGGLFFAAPDLLNQLSPIFNTAVAGTLERFFRGGSVAETLAQNVRWEEIQVALNSMTPIDWIIGKGFSARWSSDDLYKGAQRQFIHISWAGYVFWGGILFLFVMIIPLFWIVRIFLNSSSKTFTLSCASYLVVMYIRASSYSIVAANPEWALFCIVLGLIATSDITPKMHNSLMSGSK